MTSKNKPTPSKKPTTKNDDNQQSYLSIAIVFFTLGAVMLITDTTRAAGIPFLVLGITFFAISQQKPASKKKK